MATLKRDSSRKSLKRSSSRSTDSVPPERSYRRQATNTAKKFAETAKKAAAAAKATAAAAVGRGEDELKEESVKEDPDTLPMRGMLKLAALLIPAVLDIILSTLEFAVFTLDAWSDVEELVASINEKDPAWCVTISDTCQPLLEAEQVAAASTRCTDGIRCPNALIGIVLIPTAVIIVLILLFIFEWWKDLKHTWQGGHYHDKKNDTWWKDAKFYVEGEEPYYCLKKKEHQGKAYRRFREFMKLDELDDLLNMIEKKITYPCRAGEDGMWAKKNRVKPDAKA